MTTWKREGDCLGCGQNCCTLAAIPVNFDFEKHADYIKWLSYHDIEIRTVPGVGQFALLQIPCKHLQDDGKCGVHGTPDKPEMCNKWPQLPWELTLMDPKGQKECGYSFVKMEELV